MAEQIPTLANFFRLDEPAHARASAKRLENAPELKKAHMLPPALRGPAADAIIWCAKNLLDEPITNTLGGAWGKLRDLDRFRAAPADQVNEWTLHEHEIALSRKPGFDLVLNGVSTGVQLLFELKLGLTVESAVIKIQGGRVIGADLGKVHAGGSFGLGKVTIAERKTESFRLPGKLSFSPGIAIG